MTYPNEFNDSEQKKSNNVWLQVTRLILFDGARISNQAFSVLLFSLVTFNYFACHSNDNRWR